MPREKRPLSQGDALDVEATCRAVKRLQLNAPGTTTHINRAVSYSSSNPDIGDAALPVCVPASACSALEDSCTSRHVDKDVQQNGLKAHMHVKTAAQAQHCAERHATTPARLPPQRSLSSPDMSRFKFRLTLSKPPIHPTSSGKIRRQLSLTDSIDDDGALLKTTSDRHCEQERLFHQLDHQLTLNVTPPAANPITASNRSPGPAFNAALHSKVLSSTLPSSPTRGRACTTQTAVHQMKHSPLNIVVQGQSLLPEAGSDEVCQPSTPIRRENSIPVPADEQQLVGEAVFAALYEQTNVLLRNLHFERINRRASSN